jgi:hypothetical protein
MADCEKIANCEQSQIAYCDKIANCAQIANNEKSQIARKTQIAKEIVVAAQSQTLFERIRNRSAIANDFEAPNRSANTISFYKKFTSLTRMFPGFFFIFRTSVDPWRGPYLLVMKCIQPVQSLSVTILCNN